MLWVPLHSISDLCSHGTDLCSHGRQERQPPTKCSKVVAMANQASQECARVLGHAVAHFATPLHIFWSFDLCFGFSIYLSFLPVPGRWPVAVLYCKKVKKIGVSKHNQLSHWHWHQMTIVRGSGILSAGLRTRPAH